MRVDIVFPVLPPILDGIGDHTARLAEALSAHADVRVLTAQDEYDPIPGASIETAFSLPPRRGVYELVSSVRSTPPDWLFLQFNQFSYGRWGLNPYLPFVLRKIRRTVPETRLAVLFHEDFVPVTSWQNAVMTTWQRWQFWMIGRRADHVFFSINPWVQEYQSWFPNTPVDHLPAGSNIPETDADRRTVRQELGIGPDTFVIGVFGSLHDSRLLSHIYAAAKAVEGQGESCLLYVGPHGEDFEGAMSDFRVIDAGCLPPAAVSRHFRAMDIYLAPFVDGVSTRRGSFMTALQNGIPTVSTRGPLTDSFLLEQAGDAFILCPVDDRLAYGRAVEALRHKPEYRGALRKRSRRLFEEHFTWPRISARFIDAVACRGDRENVPQRSFS